MCNEVLSIEPLDVEGDYVRKLEEFFDVVNNNRIKYNNREEREKCTNLYFDIIKSRNKKEKC